MYFTFLPYLSFWGATIVVIWPLVRVKVFLYMPIVEQKHDQANVQICTILDIHLLRQVYTIPRHWLLMTKLYKFVHLGLGVPICTLLIGRERGVQICTHATFHSDKSEKQTTPRHWTHLFLLFLFFGRGGVGGMLQVFTSIQGQMCGQWG